MHKKVTRGAVAVAAATLLSTLGVTGASASGPAPRAPALGPTVATPRAVASLGTQLWARRYNGYLDHLFRGYSDEARSAAVSPDGSTVFVTGYTSVGYYQSYYTTFAYNAATGATLWLQRYIGPGNSSDEATSVAVSPDGATVFVTGYSYEGTATGWDYATIAYDAATGATLWLQRYNGPGDSSDKAASVAVSPDGSTVFVTGSTNDAYATIAYDAATGARQWVRRYSSVTIAQSMAVSPTGDTVFVTGYGGTVAYNAATGAQQWAVKQGRLSVTVSPTGDTVFVTGYSTGGTVGYNYATSAYNATTGATLWVRHYSGPGVFPGGEATSVAVSPAGDTVYVTGYSVGPTSDDDYATIAYNAATGATLWVRRYNGPGNYIDGGTSVAVSPTGRKVYVTGESAGTTASGYASYDYTTIAYNAATGATLRVRRYNGPGNGEDRATSVAVSPTGDTVFVTGHCSGPTTGYGYNTGYDYLTIAYSG